MARSRSARSTEPYRDARAGKGGEFLHLRADRGEVEEKRRARSTGRDAAKSSPRSRPSSKALRRGRSRRGARSFRDLVDAVLDFDPFMVAADFDAYWTAQRAVDSLWKQPNSWWRASITTRARMGWFSPTARSATTNEISNVAS